MAHYNRYIYLSCMKPYSSCEYRLRDQTFQLLNESYQIKEQLLPHVVHIRYSVMHAVDVLAGIL